MVHNYLKHLYASIYVPQHSNTQELFHFVTKVLPVKFSNCLVSTDTFSLTKIICHRNFGNEFAFTHSKDCMYMYLYYLARSPLSQIFDNETSPQN